ncbi:MAG: methyltransferase domain-containing protein [Thermoplasmatales archaeon]|nr:methyltransferase domain-containing protein [Thermoplasmatales archaeon]
MKLILELSGEHPTLPRAEVIACLESGFKKFRIIDEGERILVVDVKNNVSKLSCLSLSHYVDEFLFSCSAEKLFDYAKTIRVDGTFKVKVKHIGEKKPSNLERKIGDLIHGKVDLKNPENEIRIIVSERCFVGKKILRIDRKQFESRKPQFRPFFSPVSLHPRLARAIVNLSRIKQNQILFDPFCGTGGILIEAGLIGAKTVGSDIDEKMVKGCEENLKFFGIKNYTLFQSDVGDVSVKCDAIVTDPPYGRSASTKKENIGKLYERAFEAFRKTLKKDGRLVIALPDKGFMELGKNYLNLLGAYPVMVHRSLTRYFCVYRK